MPRHDRLQGLASTSRTESKDDHLRAIRLQLHMEVSSSPTASLSPTPHSLSKKLAAKQAKPQVSVTAIHDEVFSESSVSALHNLILSLCCLTISQHRHPVVDINKRGYLSKKLKAAMAQGSHLVSLNASHPHPHSNSHDIKR
jgi:hypothetical protein